MRVVVTGAAGMLGRAMMAGLTSAGHEAVGRTRADYDITDHAAASRDFAALRPDAVVNCAAYTRVDDAEDEPDQAMEINGRAPGRMAVVAAAVGARFAQLSTDYVFNGHGDRPWREDDPTNPLSAYGRSKLLGEREVIKAAPDTHLIVRASWLFGAGGRSFPRAMIERYQRGEREFRVVDDQFGRPTWTRHLARALVGCLEKGLTGIYHAGNAGAMSWFEFARLIFLRLGAADEVRVRAVSSDEWKARAVRPRYSVLDTGKLEAALGFTLPGTVEALDGFLAETGMTGPKED